MSNNEEKLFEDLALKYMDALYSNAIKLAGSATVAEELVQQTYASAFFGFKLYERDSDFGEWLNDLLMIVYMNTQPHFQELEEIYA